MRRGSYDDSAASIRPHLRSLAQRRRSAPSLVFGRALGIPWNPIREEAAVAVEQCPFVLGLSTDSSPLALDECVQLTEGQKTRERYLFLFSQELVIAKLKSSASYRLKHRLSLEKLWLYPCEDDDEEDEEEPVDSELKTSLLLVWPLAFCVVTFRSPEVKERWVETLHRKITEAQQRSCSSSPPPGILMKVLSGSIMTKTLTASMDGPPEMNCEGNGKDSAPQRQLCNKEEAGKQPIGHNASKLKLIARKWRKGSTHTGSSPHSGSSSSNQLFGQPLSKICLEDGSLPKPIKEILQLLWQKGPDTEGVFRKDGNRKNLNATREQLDSGVEVNMEALPVVQLVGLLKNFLKELPGSLLVTERYDQWIIAKEKETEEERLIEIKSVIESIPEPNILLLKHLLCVLHHISQSSDVNKMDTNNLAVCIGPTLLPPPPVSPGSMSSPTQEAVTQNEEVNKVNGLMQFLIENCCNVFGEHILTLCDPDEEEELADNSDTLSSHQHDSAYESTDPDADGDAGEVATHRWERSMVASCSSDAIFTTFTKPLNRRCSEPAIFPSAACSRMLQCPARSHDDFSAHSEDFQELKKQTSEDSFLLCRQAERRLPKLGGSCPMDLPLQPSTDRASTASKDSSCSSFSLESAASNISEGSVFTSSPLASPASLRRSQSAKHQVTSTRSQSSSSKPPSKSEQPKAEGEVMRRTQSMRLKSLGGLFNRSMKRGDPQKEPTFPCGPLQEDSQSEAETSEGPKPPEEPLRRQRPLSAIEVFQHVDSRLPSNPPSYEQALLNSAHPTPPPYRAMTVQAARELGHRSRPISMNEDLLLNSSCHMNCYMDSFQTRPGPGDPSMSEPPRAFRARAMSESVSRSRQDVLARRCSQPLFEEISYAKESYV